MNVYDYIGEWSPTREQVWISDRSWLDLVRPGAMHPCVDSVKWRPDVYPECSLPSWWMDIPECGRIRYTVEKPSQGCPVLLTAYAPEGWLWGGRTPSLLLVGRTENHALLELEDIAESWPLWSLAWSTPEAVELFGDGEGGDHTGEQDELPF